MTNAHQRDAIAHENQRQKKVEIPVAWNLCNGHECVTTATTKWAIKIRCHISKQHFLLDSVLLAKRIKPIK